MTIEGDNYGEVDTETGERTTIADIEREYFAQGAIDKLLEQYQVLEIEKAKRQTEKDADIDLAKMTGQLLRLRELSEKLTEAIQERSASFGVEAISEKQTELKEQIKQTWPDQAKKTYKSPIGVTATLRTTKSLVIDSAKAVVDFLMKNDKVEEGVKAFNLTALRQFADAGLLNDGATHYEEKQSILIKLNGTEAKECPR